MTKKPKFPLNEQILLNALKDLEENSLFPEGPSEDEIELLLQGVEERSLAHEPEIKDLLLAVEDLTDALKEFIDLYYEQYGEDND